MLVNQKTTLNLEHLLWESKETKTLFFQMELHMKA